MKKERHGGDGSVIPHEAVYGDSAWMLRLGHPESKGFIPLEVSEPEIIALLQKNGFEVSEGDPFAPDVRRLLIKNGEEIVTSLHDIPGAGLCVVDIHDREFSECFRRQ